MQVYHWDEHDQTANACRRNTCKLAEKLQFFWMNRFWNRIRLKIQNNVFLGLSPLSFSIPFALHLFVLLASHIATDCHLFERCFQLFTQGLFRHLSFLSLWINHTCDHAVHMAWATLGAHTVTLSSFSSSSATQTASKIDLSLMSQRCWLACWCVFLLCASRQRVPVSTESLVRTRAFADYQLWWSNCVPNFYVCIHNSMLVSFLYSSYKYSLIGSVGLFIASPARSRHLILSATASETKHTHTYK